MSKELSVKLIRTSDKKEIMRQEGPSYGPVHAMYNNIWLSVSVDLIFIHYSTV